MDEDIAGLKLIAYAMEKRGVTENPKEWLVRTYTNIGLTKHEIKYFVQDMKK